MVRIDLNTQSVNVLISEKEIAERRERLNYAIPEAQTWWQKIHREQVSGLSDGAVFEDMLKFNKIVKKTPRHSH